MADDALPWLYATARRVVANQRRSCYLTYERLPLNDETRSLLALDPHPGAKCSPFAGKMTGRRSVGFPNPCRGR